jgi:Mitochondrial carrier protein
MNLIFIYLLIAAALVQQAASFSTAAGVLSRGSSVAYSQRCSTQHAEPCIVAYSQRYSTQHAEPCTAEQPSLLPGLALITAAAVLLIMPGASQAADTSIHAVHSSSSLIATQLSSALDATSTALASAAAAAHFSPSESMLAGAGAGLTRGVSRLVTFPLDTIKTRRQISRLSEERFARLPPETKALAQNPESKTGLFSGLGPFILQAGPSNAAFFLT